MSQKLVTNKKAYRDYFIKDTWECGIELKGAEVKSVRDGKVNFKDSFAKLEGSEVILYNLHINPYESASYMNVKADRPRKLLLHKREIKKMFSAVSLRKMALVPTKLYFNRRGYVKVELGLGEGKKMFDKRATIKKRELDVQIGRALRNRGGRR